MERDLTSLTTPSFLTNPSLANPHDELRFQVSLLRLVYHGSLDGGPNCEARHEGGPQEAARVGQLVSRQIAEIEHLIER